MRSFDYDGLPPSLSQLPITNLLLAIRECKGKQALWEHAKPDELAALRDVARVQSIGASNRIEGIATTEKRLRALVLHSVQPQNRNEEEIIGYRDVLSLIHGQHDDIPITPGVILQLHRDLMSHTAATYGGRWKDSDNEIVAFDEQGCAYVRFRPTPAIATPGAMEQLCHAYNRAFSAERYDPLLLACRFAFDFVSIHPFNDGNGRMSRLLTVLLMERAGYDVGKYVSIEHCIEKSKEQYYEALAASSTGWDQGENDEAPFVRYLLGVVLGAYRELERRMESLGGAGSSSKTKADRVAEVFAQHAGRVTKRMIMEECPDISEVTVKRALQDLVDRGTIQKVGTGKNTAYIMA